MIIVKAHYQCLRVGISKIAGYGLYMDQDCPKGTVIGGQRRDLCL